MEKSQNVRTKNAFTPKKNNHNYTYIYIYIYIYSNYI